MVRFVAKSVTEIRMVKARHRFIQICSCCGIKIISFGLLVVLNDNIGNNCVNNLNGNHQSWTNSLAMEYTSRYMLFLIRLIMMSVGLWSLLMELL